MSAFYFLIIGYNQVGAILIAILLFFTAALLLVNSEVGRLMMSRSAHPIQLFENGVKVYASPKEKRRGFNGFISADCIKSIHIRRRGDMSEEWFTRIPIIRQGFARKQLHERGFVELVIETKDGIILHTGVKPVETINDIITEMRTRWKIRAAP
jgi:hypothetical protein